MKNLILTFCLPILCLNLVIGQDGVIDQEFGENGWFIFPSEGQVSNLEVQQDGKILLQDGDKVMRLLPSGIIDNVFDFDGQLTDTYAFKVLEDGKILTLLSFFFEKEDYLVRLKSNGLPDPEFGVNGRVDISGQFNTFRGSWAETILVKPNGKINLTTINSSPNDNLELTIAQYLPDGSIDTEFGENGISIPLPGVKVYSAESTRGILATPDNSLIFLGECGDRDWCIFKLLDDGTLDENFGTGGRIGTSLYFNYVGDLAIQNDGKIIVGGNMEPNDVIDENEDFLLVRYNTDGSIDTDFGDNGLVRTNLNEPNTKTETIYDLLIQDDGKILAVGQGAGNSVITPGFLEFDYSAIGVARYLPNGDLDKSFSQDGFEVIEFFNDGGITDLGVLREAQVALGPDGSIFIGADTGDDLDPNSIVVVKLTNDITTSISDIKSAFKVYPNPASNFLEIELDNPESSFSWQLLDLQGRSVKNGTARGTGTRIELSSMLTGMYILDIQTPTQRTYQKIQISR